MRVLSSAALRPDLTHRSTVGFAGGVVLLVAGACRPDPASPACPTVTVPEDLQVAVHLDWTTEEPSTAKVAYGVDDTLAQHFVVDAVPTTRHHAVLLDLPPDSKVTWKTTTTIDGVDQVCEGTARTGSLPSYLPNLTVVTNDLPDGYTGKYLMGALTIGDRILFVLDREGNWVWYKQLSEGHEVVQFQPAADADAWVYGDFSSDHSLDRGRAVYIDRLGNEIGQRRLDRGHHFFAQLEDGTIAFCAVDIRDWVNPSTGETLSVVGDVLREIAPDGTTRDLYDTWDYLDVEEGAFWSSDFYPDRYDWTHCNAVKYLPDSDTYLVSFGGIRLIAQIDRQTGEPVTYFNGDRRPDYGGYTVAGSRGFDRQHDPSFTSDGDLLMLSTRDDTRAIEYSLDDETLTLQQVWSFGASLGEASPVMGQARRLDNGDTFLNFGMIGKMREVDSRHRILWEIDLEPTYWIGNVVLLDDLHSVPVMAGQ